MSEELKGSERSCCSRLPGGVPRLGQTRRSNLASACPRCGLEEGSGVLLSDDRVSPRSPTLFHQFLREPNPQMRTMCDEAEARTCEEDLGSDEEGDEADVESYLEDNSSELVDRLRELEAENSALMLANENQREAYERCLDEVANHVVQALLNQKDLREECIKLKMLVFDLERQNRALCELFQQKLPNQPAGTRLQVPAGPVPDCSAQPHGAAAKEAEPAPTDAHAKGNGFRPQHAPPGPGGPAASMEALSPFFKKKAHILEVLRKMEETDPLKFHPSAASLSFCDYSQVLMSAEAVLAPPDAPPPQCQSQHTHCHCSRSDADIHRHVNGDEAAAGRGGSSCCSHCKRSPESPQSPQRPQRPCGGHAYRPPPPPAALQTLVPPPALTDGLSPNRPGEAAPPKLRTRNEIHQQPACPAAPPSVNQSLQGAGAEQGTSNGGGNASEELSGFCSSSAPSVQVSRCDTDTRSGALDGAPSVSGAAPSDSSAASQLESTAQDASAVRASASVSPSPSCLSDVKAAAISSPSKLLKFLKIPAIGDKSPGSSCAVRLSPQLTRSSRIPCRTNNYEVYHSPVPTRRATTTERCRQPPPPPARSESYPTTHSAPTSPPQPGDSCSPPAREIICSIDCSPQASRRVPHYENVSEVSREEEPARGPDRRTAPPAHAKANGAERKLIKSLPESILNPAPQRKESSSSTSESTSDDEEDSDSPLWASHHSPPHSPGPAGAQGRSYSQARDKQDTDAGEVVTQAPPPTRRNESSSIPKRPTSSTARAPADSGHHAFKDRLAALGKLRSSEDLQVGLKHVDTASEDRSKTAERPAEVLKEEQRHWKHTLDSLDTKPKSSTGGLKLPGPDQAAKAPPAAGRKELCVKQEGSRSKTGLPSPNTDAPQVLRNNIKCPGSLNLAHGVKSHSSHSPNKVPPKSPSKPCPGPAVYRGKPSEAPRYSSKSEERTKISGKGKKNPMYGDSLPPPPPRPPSAEGAKPAPSAPCPRSAIEQKVMKGIEENVLKLQEQDRGGQGGEAKQKASNGIASWFGLKKSKLPALSRKADGAKAKDEKKEWRINIPSVGRDSAKMAARCKEGVEGLNISTLMEKAEGLRRALEEERAYVERSGRGHSCEVVMDQAQGELAVMYRGARSDNFMQQLLNRVDGKDVVRMPQRRLSFDCKTSKFCPQSDGLDQGSQRMAKITSDENLADPVHSQHFAGSAVSTHTLDSGIGTFPLPDCGAGRALSRTRTGSGSPGRAGRRARTLERELTLQEESCVPHKQLIAAAALGSALEGRGPAGGGSHGAGVFSPRSKTWTFPTAKNPAAPGEVYLAVEEEEEEAAPFVSPFRASLKTGGPPPGRPADPASLPVPVQAPSGPARRGKPRTPAVPEVGLEDALSPSRPQILETPESLSDSLYDSLSSCGSQG